MAKRQIKVTAAKFEQLYQAAKQPVIYVSEVNAFLTIGNVEYVTPRPARVAS